MRPGGAGGRVLFGHHIVTCVVFRNRGSERDFWYRVVGHGGDNGEGRENWRVTYIWVGEKRSLLSASAIFPHACA